MTLLSTWLQLCAAMFAFACVLDLLRRPKKQTIHVIWAVFAGSIAMLMVKRLAGDAAGAHQFLIGLFACATCNAYWLLARALFRRTAAVQWPHLLVAAAIAGLLILDQSLRWLIAKGQIQAPTLTPALAGIDATLSMLSSTILVLGFLEGLRGYATANAAEQAMRRLFLISYGSCVAICTLVPPMLNHDRPISYLLGSASALFMLLVTYRLVAWREQQVFVAEPLCTPEGHTDLGNRSQSVPREEPISAEDQALADTLRQLLHRDQLYLQAELKVADLAERMHLPEYRISRLITGALGERNFNQWINRARIEHAKTLLAEPAKQHWPVLVIGLESGFASLGPFNRAFKTQVGMTPGEYRSKARKRDNTPSTADASC